MSPERTYYLLGKYDMVAELFAAIRLNGVDNTLKEFAEIMLKWNPNDPNVHAQWFLNEKK